MKESYNTASRPLTAAQIGDDVNLSATLGVRYITVDTPWDYPSYMKLWVDAIRATGRSVWFRIHPNAWQGSFGVAATLTPSGYLTAEASFIEANAAMFHSGDILDANPEPENGPFWRTTYGTGWSKNQTALAVYNKFFTDVSDTAAAALATAGVQGVTTTIRSTNSWWASHPSALWPSAVAHEGFVTFDSYPDANDTTATAAVQHRLAEMNSIEAARPGMPLIIGELGYSNAINVDDATQHAVVAAELQALSPDPCVAGLNYWVGAGTQNSGGYTHLFSGSTGNWSLRPAAHDLAAYAATKG